MHTHDHESRLTRSGKQILEEVDLVGSFHLISTQSLLLNIIYLFIFFFDPLSKSKQNSAADIPNSTPVNGNLWEFKDAFSETGAKHKLEEARAATPTF
ncbi:hypothetical protein EV1_004776 [Malus domestica]